MLVLERSVGLHGEYRDAAARIVGDDQELAGRIERLPNAVLAAGRALVEQLGLAGRAIKREGGRILAVAVNGIEKALVGAERQERRIDEIADVLDVRPCAGGRIGTIDM